MFRPVLYICGLLTLIMALLMLIPLGMAMAANEPEFSAFLTAILLTSGLGVFLSLTFYVRQVNLNSRQLYLLTSLSWLVLSFSGALPFAFCREHLSITNAFFESVSGITTTGSTVLVHIETLPKSILLWRSVLQWVGGVGVIGMAVSIMPFLKIGGMRLFKTESSDWSEKSLPRFQEFAKTLLFCYLFMSILCALCYHLAGMNSFDAINHAMTTISTGGFSTTDASMGRFDGSILWVATIFMLAGALPFTLFIRLILHRSFAGITMEQQARGFLKLVLTIVAILSLHLVLTGVMGLGDAITHSAFNVASVITTTGYASADYTLWGEFSISLFFLITFIGGCSGSTAGGMKIFRFQISMQFLKTQLQKLVHPRGVFTIHYGGKMVEEDIISSAVAFSFMFFLALALLTLLLSAMGVDFMTSFTGVATALTNVGPGLGEMIGPAGNFAALPDMAKWVLSFAMILGRLELLTVIVLFSAAFWKH